MKNQIGLREIFVTILFVHVCCGNICTNQQDCTQCIAKSNCAWCTNPDYESLNHHEGNRPRCNTVEGHESQKFCANSLENPQSTIHETNPSDPKGEKHISPQSIKAKLRVEKPIEFILTYAESQDKPLDLYYIMDLSATMEDDKDTVARQGGTLAQELKKITKDLLIGFGSFIDKPVMPFVSSTQLEGKQGSKAIPYGFKNHLNLTNDIELFKGTVNRAEISANLDAPEGGLDAIMQAISCDGIGWRDKARKLIVMATDGPFHIAGDGKLGGIVRPNDGSCHMANNTYTHSTLLDYPSVAQLNSKVLEKKAYVIFAIGLEHLALYEQLSRRISSSAAAGLEADSTNVVNLVRNEYQKISERVKIVTEPQRLSFLTISFLADCGNNGNFIATDQCQNVKVGNSVKFKIKVELTKCPKPTELPPNSKVNIDFTTFDLRNKDYLRLEIEPLCSCACSKEKQQPEKVREICQDNDAFMQCGLCHCGKDRHGRNCECSKNGEEGVLGDAPCITPNTTDICSNRGKCECGVCKCGSDHGVQYSGKYCQFDDSTCRDEGSYEILCSGQGECEEGKCACRPNYEGDRCQCSTEKTKCIEPGSPLTDVCNGNGVCECSQQRKCNCKGNYAGLYCQKCSTGCSSSSSSKSRCKDKRLQACIKCHLDEYRKKDAKKYEPQCQSECKIPAKIAGDIDTHQVMLTDSISAKDNEIRCTLEYTDKCSTEFLYSYQPNPRLTLKVVASTSLNCVEEPPYLWYIIGVIGGVLLIGIFLLLLWKLITHLHDKREYGRFEKERAGARWDKSENPLYSKPTTEFQNPAYKG